MTMPPDENKSPATDDCGTSAAAGQADGRPADAIASVDEVLCDVRKQLAEMSAQIGGTANPGTEGTNQPTESNEGASPQDVTNFAARLQQLSELERELRNRAEALDSEREALQRKAVQPDTSSIARAVKQRAAIRERIATVRRHESELARRIQLARQDLVKQRAELEGRQADLSARVETLEQQEQALQAARAAAVDGDPPQIDLDVEEQRLLAERSALEHVGQDLLRERTQLLEREREYEQLWSGTHGRAFELARRADEIESERSRLEEQRAQLDELEQRLTAEQADLQERQQTHEGEREDLAVWRADLDERAGQLEAAERETAAMEARARELQDDAEQLQHQAEIREDALRQRTLALEMEQQKIEREKDRLDDLRDTAERSQHKRGVHNDIELTKARGEIRRLNKKLDRARRRSTSGGRMWRITLMALLAAALGAAGWLSAVPAEFRAERKLALQMNQTTPETAFDECRSDLLDPALLDVAQVPDAALRSAWRAACEGGHAAAEMQEAGAADALAVRFTIVANNPDFAENLARAATSAYETALVRAESHVNLPPAYDDLAEYGQQLREQLDTLRAEREHVALQLDGFAGAEERGRAADELDGYLAALDETVARLTAARAQLADLAAREPDAGIVDPADVAAALDSDTIYSEDLAESTTAALDFRTELVVSMLVLVDPARELRDVIEQYAVTVAEQRDLTPPPDVAAVLEQVATALDEAEGRLQTFADAWEVDAEFAKALSPTRDVVELVERQNAAVDTARRESDAVAQVTADLAQEIESLVTEGDGGTRRVVVAAVLRGEQGALQAKVDEFVDAAGGISLDGNFELETHDRRLRGLRMRLTERQDAVTQRLQLEADRAARQTLIERVEQAREDVALLERQREELLGRIVLGINALREADEVVWQRTALEERVALLDREITAVTSQLEQVDLTVSEARRVGGPIASVELGEVWTEPLNPERIFHAGFAGAAAFATVWLTGVALFAIPGARRDDA